jgi:signal transduction histidine kinase/PAS domain-containing protein
MNLANERENSAPGSYIRTFGDRPEILELRRKLLDILLYFLAILGLPVWIVGLYKHLPHAHWYLATFNSLIYLTGVAVLILRNRIPVNLRALLMLLLFYGWSLLILMTYGLTGVGIYPMIAMGVFATLLFGSRMGVVALVLGSIGIALVGALVHQDIVEPLSGFMAGPNSAGDWALAVLLFLVLTGFAFFCYRVLQERLFGSLDEAERNAMQLENVNTRLLIEVTERERAERSVQTLNREIELVLDASNTSLDIIDPDFNIHYVSPARRALYGDPTGQKCYDYFSNACGPLENCPMKIALRKKAPVVSYTVVEDTDYMVKSVPFESAPGEWLVAEISVDITEQKRAETKLREALTMAREAETLKSTFLSYMSHEIRTPLNHIIGLTSIVRMGIDDLPPEKTNRYLSMVLDSARSLLEIIETMLDLSRIESGKFEITQAPFDFHGLVRGIGEQFSTEAKAKHLEFRWEMDESIPAELIGDRFYCERILSNLLSNAIKFSNEGFVSLNVELKPPENEKVVLQFTVADSGIGIDPEKEEKIFQAFFQADMTSTREYYGTGLGLTISRELARLMGGDIRVESEPGKGTTFYFTGVFRTE